jgi:glycosyltransferase involved in cell wall biosynthesis
MSKENIFLSVVIPCYNCDSTISDTIFSICRQSKAVHLEIICIDDCSTDSTLEVLEQLKSAVEDLSVFKTEYRTGRPSTPRNIGIDKSNGEIIMFMDADDLLPFNYFEKCLIHVTDRQFVGSFKHTFYSIAPRLDFYKDHNAQAFLVPRAVLYSKNMFSMSGLLVSKASLKNIKFINNYLEDWRLLTQLYRNNIRGLLFLSPRVFYRSHENSITPKRKSKQIKRVFLALNDMHGSISSIFLFVGYFFFGALKIILENNHRVFKSNTTTRLNDD